MNLTFPESTFVQTQFFFYSIAGRCSFDEQAAKCAIIDAIEEFICGDNPQTVLEKLRLEGNVSSVCGQIFKVGEPTYSCRECGKI